MGVNRKLITNYAVCNGKVRIGLHDWIDAHKLREQIIAKYGPDACDEVGGSCFSVYLTPEQIAPFDVQGPPPYLCPICGEKKRMKPVRVDGDREVFKCPNCGIEGRVKGDTVEVAYNKETRMRHAQIKNVRVENSRSGKPDCPL